MESFRAAKAFVAHLQYAPDRLRTLAAMDPGSIDEPIRDIVAALAQRSDCYSLQSCWGHFICHDGQDRHTLEPIADGYMGSVRYRIAYIALCIENSRNGRILRNLLSEIPALAPDGIQFGSAGWFWERCVNTYVLQVAPSRHKDKDEMLLDGEEARQVQTIRDRFFRELKRSL